MNTNLNKTNYILGKGRQVRSYTNYCCLPEEHTVGLLSAMTAEVLSGATLLVLDIDDITAVKDTLLHWTLLHCVPFLELHPCRVTVLLAMLCI